MEREEVRKYVNQYCKLRDVQFAAYELYARKHGLTAKELFVLDLIWLTESETDRRNKIIRLTGEGKKYVKKIIPPAAIAEIDAMAELSGEDIAELVRLTVLFSNYMKQHFDGIKES